MKFKKFLNYLMRFIGSLNIKKLVLFYKIGLIQELKPIYFSLNVGCVHRGFGLIGFSLQNISLILLS